jgi:hypothetical protein
MRSISVQESDLLCFFESEPERLDANVPWPYNDFTYRVVRGELDLSFTIAPAMKDVRFTLKANGRVLYELNAAGIADVRYRHDLGRESLELILNPRATLWLTLRPEIALRHAVTTDLDVT